MALELRRAGWTGACALVGGWAAWQAAGLPLAPRTFARDDQPDE